jgi:Secretion system C-terminal sorting domain
LSTTAAGSLLWSNGAVTPSITVTNAETYTVTTTINGCTSVPGSGTSTISTPLTAVCTNSNNTLYFGYSGDQTTNITGRATGGTAPYSISITMNRPLKCNFINDAGDEKWIVSGGTTLNNTCPSNPGLATTAPVSTRTNIAAGGSYAVNLTLMTDATITITVTDAAGCVSTCTTKVYAEDVRCFAGNSGNSKVTICHKTGSTKTPCVKICISAEDVLDHLNHGDFLGNCTSTCLPPPPVAARPVAEMSSGDGKLSLKVIPNPTSTSFNLVMTSAVKEKMYIRVTDIAGRLIEERSGVNANSTIQLGDRYSQGMYFAEVIQGSERLLVRLLKQR